MGSIRDVWNNTLYRFTCVYVVVMITSIFALQVHRFFFALPAEDIVCPQRPSAIMLVPVIGVFFDG